jgi:hypothetical protein
MLRCESGDHRSAARAEDPAPSVTGVEPEATARRFSSSRVDAVTATPPMRSHRHLVGAHEPRSGPNDRCQRRTRRQSEKGSGRPPLLAHRHPHCRKATASDHAARMDGDCEVDRWCLNARAMRAARTDRRHQPTPHRPRLCLRRRRGPKLVVVWGTRLVRRSRPRPQAQRRPTGPGGAHGPRGGTDRSVPGRRP